MKYWIGRNGKRYGPYTEEQVRAGHERGQLKADDLLWAEGWKEWVRIDLAMKSMLPPPLPVPPQPAPPAKSPSPAATPAFNPYSPPESRVDDGGGKARGTPDFPLPPGLHWAVVLLLTIVTFGAFQLIWLIVQTVWTRKLDAHAPLGWAITACVLFFVGVVVEVANAAGAGGLVALLSVACTLVQVVGWIVAVFGNRRVMISYFKQHHDLDLEIGGVATFFVGIYYHQWYMSKLRRWRVTGELDLGARGRVSTAT